MRRLSSSRNAGTVDRPRRHGSLSIVDGNQHQHAVQFYESDEFLVRSVTEYLIAGFKADEPVVVIATPEHREGFALALAARGVDVEWSRRRGLLTEFDARSLLSSFMVNGAPD